jgi:hypothetical protein
MPVKDRCIDAYVARAAPFARPVLVHLRGVIHAAVPDVEETIKWGMPHFTRGGILCAVAAFDRFTPSRRRDYVEWILEAKRPDTRAERIESAIAWMAEGKSRNWKYEKC